MMTEEGQSRQGDSNPAAVVDTAASIPTPIAQGEKGEERKAEESVEGREPANLGTGRTGKDTAEGDLEREREGLGEEAQGREAEIPKSSIKDETIVPKAPEVTTNVAPPPAIHSPAEDQRKSQETIPEAPVREESKATAPSEPSKTVSPVPEHLETAEEALHKAAKPVEELTPPLKEEEKSEKPQVADPVFKAAVMPGHRPAEESKKEETAVEERKGALEEPAILTIEVAPSGAKPAEAPEVVAVPLSKEDQKPPAPDPNIQVSELPENDLKLSSAKVPDISIPEDTKTEEIAHTAVAAMPKAPKKEKLKGKKQHSEPVHESQKDKPAAEEKQVDVHVKVEEKAKLPSAEIAAPVEEHKTIVAESPIEHSLVKPANDEEKKAKHSEEEAPTLPVKEVKVESHEEKTGGKRGKKAGHHSSDGKAEERKHAEAAPTTVEVVAEQPAPSAKAEDTKSEEKPQFPAVEERQERQPAISQLEGKHEDKPPSAPQEVVKNDESTLSLEEAKHKGKPLHIPEAVEHKEEPLLPSQEVKHEENPSQVAGQKEQISLPPQEEKPRLPAEEGKHEFVNLMEKKSEVHPQLPPPEITHQDKPLNDVLAAEHKGESPLPPQGPKYEEKPPPAPLVIEEKGQLPVPPHEEKHGEKDLHTAPVTDHREEQPFPPQEEEHDEKPLHTAPVTDHREELPLPPQEEKPMHTSPATGHREEPSLPLQKELSLPPQEEKHDEKPLYTASVTGHREEPPLPSHEELPLPPQEVKHTENPLLPTQEVKHEGQSSPLPQEEVKRESHPLPVQSAQERLASMKSDGKLRGESTISEPAPEAPPSTASEAAIAYKPQVQTASSAAHKDPLTATAEEQKQVATQPADPKPATMSGERGKNEIIATRSGDRPIPQSRKSPPDHHSSKSCANCELQ